MEQIRLLSRREKEVILLLQQGKSNKQIALSLGVSEHTVEFHLKNVYAKLHVNSRVELILKLGKVVGDINEKQGESVVDVLDKNIHNGKQPAIQNRWAQPLKNVIFTTKKEFAMTKIIVSEDVGNFLRRHPLYFSLPLFLIISLISRSLIFDFGLYFWQSYVLLGVLLAIGSIYFGLSWRKITDGKIHFLPLIIAVIMVLPMLVALTDLILLHTIAKAGQVSLTIGLMKTKALWLVSPDGHPYLYTERLMVTDTLWLYANLYMIALFLVGVLSNKWFKRKNLAVV